MVHFFQFLIFTDLFERTSSFQAKGKKAREEKNIESPSLFFFFNYLKAQTQMPQLKKKKRIKYNQEKFKHFEFLCKIFQWLLYVT